MQGQLSQAQTQVHSQQSWLQRLTTALQEGSSVSAAADDAGSGALAEAAMQHISNLQTQVQTAQQQQACAEEQAAQLQTQASQLRCDLTLSLHLFMYAHSRVAQGSPLFTQALLIAKK